MIQRDSHETTDVKCRLNANGHGTRRSGDNNNNNSNNNEMQPLMFANLSSN